MTATTPSNSTPDNEPEKGVPPKREDDRDQQDLMRQIEARAKADAQDHFRELRKHTMRGVAFECGKQTVKWLIELLKQQ